MIRDLVVELVSPTMVGGAVKGACDDPPTLRPPSLRGHLRFWSRALGGDELADSLWGTTESGQRVRLLLARGTGAGGRLRKLREATLIPSRNFQTAMIPPGDSVLLRFAIPNSSLLPRLQAVVWTWLHLGAVGRRSRRGYGSLRWRPAADDLLTGWPPLWPSHHLKDRSTLEDHLLAGFTQVRAVLGVPGEEPRSPACKDQLLTVDQVFVGKELAGEWEAALNGPAQIGGAETLESLLHGRNERHRGGEPDSLQLGCGKPRRPSPMLWRVFHVPDRKAFVPVLTWFPYGYEGEITPRLAEPEVREYLYRDLGFDISLTGGSLFTPAEDDEVSAAPR